MTGFGRARREAEGILLEVELRSVNHRFLDVVCKLPPAYASLEQEVVKRVREKLSRGRVEVSINRTESGTGGVRVNFNKELFRAYWQAVGDALAEAKLKSAAAREQAALQLLSRREVLETVNDTVEDEAELALLYAALEEGLRSLLEMRRSEGEALSSEILRLLAEFEQSIEQLTRESRETVSVFKEKLAARLEKLAPEVEIDPARLAQEVAILADRTDITEELSRLRSHLEQFRLLLAQPGNGRKLDFLIQEMGREVNTCGSKAQNSQVQLHVVDAKAGLEKIREQIQNIE